jgi:hypothetical protein
MFIFIDWNFSRLQLVQTSSRRVDPVIVPCRARSDAGMVA